MSQEENPSNDQAPLDKTNPEIEQQYINKVIEEDLQEE